MYIVGMVTHNTLQHVYTKAYFIGLSHQFLIRVYVLFYMNKIIIRIPNGIDIINSCLVTNSNMYSDQKKKHNYTHQVTFQHYSK